MSSVELKQYPELESATKPQAGEGLIIWQDEKLKKVFLEDVTREIGISTLPEIEDLYLDLDADENIVIYQDGKPKKINVLDLGIDLGIIQKWALMYNEEEESWEDAGFEVGDYVFHDGYLWRKVLEGGDNEPPVEPIWGKVLDNSQLAQELGDSEEKAISQKAVTDAIAISGVAGIGLGFSKPIRRQVAIGKLGVTDIRLPSGLTALVNNQQVTLSGNLDLSLATKLDTGIPVAGTDYFVYLLEDSTAFISATEQPYLNSGRLIGGFHYGLTGHSEVKTGNKTEDDMLKLRGINSHTFWDLAFRAKKDTNKGLTFIGDDWVDIYLADEDYGLRGFSQAGGWIAGGTIEHGRKYPKIPLLFGGDGSDTYGKLTPFQAMDLAAAANMKLIPYSMFIKLAYGVEEGLSSSGIEDVTGRIEHYPQLTSKFGVEQATGVQYVWGADFASRTLGTSFEWMGLADGRGQVFMNHNYQLVMLRLGASRGRSSEAGSRSAVADGTLTGSYWGNGLRCFCDHLVLD